MPKRSLILAGGGVKVSFQAGVLQVWLDEAGIEFDHGDGVSAACFNLAMWAQGMTGARIADNWRAAEPLGGIDLDARQLARLLYAESLLELDGYRSRVFPAWGLDCAKVRAGGREATFNIYNFSEHELVPVPSAELTEDHLIATASLPLWFPPVRIAGRTYIDAVLLTPCNLEEAIRRGADELWIIWTTSQRGEWFDGFVGNYFGIFEATANHAYKSSLARIGRNNDAIARGEPGEYGRPILVRELKAEVPVHYLLNANRDRAIEAVNRGVEAARAWCDANGIPYRRGADVPAAAAEAPTRLHFAETLKGYVGFGAADYHAGYDQGARAGTVIEMRLTVHVDGVPRFITDPEHEATIEGTVACDALGGRRAIRDGTFNLFVDEGDPARKRVTYRVALEDAQGGLLTLCGIKDLHDDRDHDALHDATTLFVKVYRGPGPADDRLVATGIMRVGPVEFLEQFATFRVEGPTIAERTSLLARFGAFYLGRLWDVYARRLLPSAPF